VFYVPEGRRDHTTPVSGFHDNKRMLETTLKPLGNQFKFFQLFLGILSSIGKGISLLNKEKDNN